MTDGIINNDLTLVPSFTIFEILKIQSGKQIHMILDFYLWVSEHF